MGRMMYGRFEMSDFIAGVNQWYEFQLMVWGLPVVWVSNRVKGCGECI